MIHIREIEVKQGNEKCLSFFVVLCLKMEPSARKTEKLQGCGNGLFFGNLTQKRGNANFLMLLSEKFCS